MTKSTAKPRRTRVPGDGNHNLYVTAAGRYEIGWKDAQGKQRWKTAPEGSGIMAARRLRDQLLAARGRGERAPINAKLTFGAASDRWKTDHVANLRPTTAAAYGFALRHAHRRFANTRLDRIGPDDLARMVTELRAEGLSEWTISGVLNSVNQTYRYATRRLGSGAPNPVTAMDRSERAKVSATPRRVVFTADQIRETIEAATEPWRMLFTVTALTGARQSEVLGLLWSDLRLDDLDDAEVVYRAQLSRAGKRVAVKSEDSAREVPITRALAERLAEFKMARGLAGHDTTATAYVFATKSGRAISQRNASRALRVAQTKAKRPDGRWTFPVLHETKPGPDGKPVPIKVPRGTIPSTHSYRHAFASLSFADGESIDEVAFLLGHRDGTVTRAVYLHEVRDAERRANRRAAIGGRLGSVMEAHPATPDDTATADLA